MKNLYRKIVVLAVASGLSVTTLTCTGNRTLEKRIQNNEIKPGIVEQADMGEISDWALAKQSYSIYLIGTDRYNRLQVRERTPPITIRDGPPEHYIKRGESPAVVLNIIESVDENGKVLYIPEGLKAYYIIEATDENEKVLYSCEDGAGYSYVDYPGEDGKMTGGKVPVAPLSVQLFVELPADKKINSILVWYAKMNFKTKKLVKVNLAIDPLKVDPLKVPTLESIFESYKKERNED